MEELFVTGRTKGKVQRKTTVNVCVQYEEVYITASIRSHQKYERQEDVEIRDRQRLQKTRHLEREALLLLTPTETVGTLCLSKQVISNRMCHVW